MQQEEISLKDLWNLFKKHAFRIFSLMIVGIIASILFMIFLVIPQYESQAQLLVNSRDQSVTQNTIQYSELQASSQLINTYRDIIRGDAVLTEVSDEMNNVLSVSELRNAISVEQSPNSQAFNVTVQTDSPQRSQDILYSVITQFEEVVREVYEESNIFILSPASYNPNRVSPSLPIYAIIGALIGIALSVLLILILEISDTTVKDEEFMNSLGITHLGSINELSAKEVKQSRIASSTKTRERKAV